MFYIQYVISRCVIKGLYCAMQINLKKPWSFEKTENLHNLKTVDCYNTSLFMRNNGSCNNSHYHGVFCSLQDPIILEGPEPE